jgi:hypothetical protein
MPDDGKLTFTAKEINEFVEIALATGVGIAEENLSSARRKRR